VNLERVLSLGFDRSTQEGKYISVRCSRCEALVINGVPCHEAGCTNHDVLDDDEDDDWADPAADGWDNWPTEEPSE
jgi:hypothetical protein